VEGANDVSAEEVSGEDEALLRFIIGGFALAGKLAKIDGRVSKEEIAVVTSAITELEVDEEGERILREVFREAKESPHDYQEVAHDIARLLEGDANLALELVSFLLEIAVADGEYSTSEESFIDEVRCILGVPAEVYQTLLEEKVPRARLLKYYEALGLPPGSSTGEVKRKYHRLVRRSRSTPPVSPASSFSLAVPESRDLIPLFV